MPEQFPLRLGRFERMVEHKDLPLSFLLAGVAAGAGIAVCSAFMSPQALLPAATAIGVLAGVAWGWFARTGYWRDYDARVARALRWASMHPSEAERAKRTALFHAQGCAGCEEQFLASGREHQRSHRVGIDGDATSSAVALGAGHALAGAGPLNGSSAADSQHDWAFQSPAHDFNAGFHDAGAGHMDFGSGIAVNTDGAPMFGPVDSNGHTYGSTL